MTHYSVGLIFRMKAQPLISGYAQGLPWYAWQGTDRCQPSTTDAWELIGTGPMDLQAALSVALALAHNYTNICRHAGMLLSSMYALLVLYHIILFIAAWLGLNVILLNSYSTVYCLDSNNSLGKKIHIICMWSQFLETVILWHWLACWNSKKVPGLSPCVGQRLFLLLWHPPTVHSLVFGWCKVSWRL